MTSYDDALGNSNIEKISESGCYVTIFADVFASSIYYGKPLENSGKYISPLEINMNKKLFAEKSASFSGRTTSMDALFGKGKWDYWTKANQGTEGLLAKMREYKKSDKAYMIMGIFNLSSDTPNVKNHMVGLSELPNIDGYFTSGITAASKGDYDRYININEKSAYTISNLKEIRVILLED